MYELIDNLVTSSDADRLQNFLLSTDFPWYFNEYVIDKKVYNESFLEDKNTIESNQFTHVFFSDGVIRSKFFEMVMPIVMLLEIRMERSFSNRLVRVKANLLTKNSSYEDGQHNTPHTDSSSFPGESLLYYVNDSDGDTFIFNEKRGTDFKDLTLNKRVTPKRGKCMFFDSEYYHASSCPKNSDVRVVINFLFNK